MKYTDEQIADIGENIIKALKTVFDPEIPVDIYELGLVYDVQISDEGAVKIIMTLTTPNCPVADSLPAEVREAPGVQAVADALGQLVVKVQIMHHRQAHGQHLLRREQVADVGP